MNTGIPKGIRTPVTAVKGRCPRPLDDGDPDIYSLGSINKEWSINSIPKAVEMNLKNLAVIPLDSGTTSCFYTLKQETSVISLVEPSGIEPLTSTLPVLRSPS